METLSQRLKKLRSEQELTLEYVAKILNTTKSTISRYEKGTREPKSETLNSLASFYNVSVDYLLCRTDKRNYITEKNFNNINLDILEDMKDLNEESIDKIKEYIKLIRLSENKNKSSSVFQEKSS